MAITDELRNYVYGREGMGVSPLMCGTFAAIADRIDAEHTKAQRRWMAELDAARDRDGWVELPKDVDGEYIHVGDVMEWVPYDDTYQLVIRTVSGVGADVFFAWSGANCQYGQYDAQAFRHYHKPTVEDVMVEFATDWESAQDGEDKTAVLKEYAAKLRLAESEES